VLELNAIENLALHGGFARGAFGRVDWREQASMTRRVLERFAVELEIDRPLSAAPAVARTAVAVAIALQGWEGGHGVLVLDEPTATLAPAEVRQLFEIVREVQRAGTSVLYVSHRMDEIFELADRVTVLRGGRATDTMAAAETTPRELAELMSGREVEHDFRIAPSAEGSADLALEVRGLTGHWLRGVDLSVRRGEILGLAGLNGSGREELPYAIAGAGGPAFSGEMRLPGVSADWRSINDPPAGEVAIVPADRLAEGVIADFSVKENLTLAALGSLGTRGRIDGRRRRRLAEEWIERLEIRTADADAPISTLSGGNQQKVVIARCLVTAPSILVLCEPTAGVDIATRVALYRLIAGLVEDGLTVIVSSTDVDDLLAMCTRIVVMRGGVVGGELDREGISDAAVLHAMEGTD
jgi:ABC-type sugar transport system ATPase subunit